MKYFLSTIIALVFFACNEDKSTRIEKEMVSDSINVAADSVSSLDSSVSSKPLTDGLELFTNMEWVSYCVPLPILEYPESFDEESEKGKHVFAQNGNKKSQIIVTGMMRSDETVSLEDYFKNTYTQEDEEQGKIITKKNIMKRKNGFYAKGYWNNLIYDERFFEILWFRKDEVVKLEVNYSLKDSTKWNSWFESILNSSSDCEE